MTLTVYRDAPIGNLVQKLLKITLFRKLGNRQKNKHNFQNDLDVYLRCFANITILFLAYRDLTVEFTVNPKMMSKGGMIVVLLKEVMTTNFQHIFDIVQRYRSFREN